MNQADTCLVYTAKVVPNDIHFLMNSFVLIHLTLFCNNSVIITV